MSALLACSPPAPRVRRRCRCAGQCPSLVLVGSGASANAIPHRSFPNTLLITPGAGCGLPRPRLSICKRMPARRPDGWVVRRNCRDGRRIDQRGTSDLRAAVSSRSAHHQEVPQQQRPGTRLPAFIPASFITTGIPAMQKPALSTHLVGLTEDLEFDFAARAADGEICQNDIAHLLPQIRLVVIGAQRVDLAQAAGLAVIRGGQDAQRASRLLTELQTWQPEEAA